MKIIDAQNFSFVIDDPLSAVRGWNTQIKLRVKPDELPQQPSKDATGTEVLVFEAKALWFDEPRGQVRLVTTIIQ